jgi:hypothetical protein
MLANERDASKAMELLRKAVPGDRHEFSIAWALLVLLENKRETLVRARGKLTH